MLSAIEEAILEICPILLLHHLPLRALSLVKLGHLSHFFHLLFAHRTIVGVVIRRLVLVGLRTIL